MTFTYLEYPIDDIMRYFVDGFTPQDGQTVEGHEWFYDAAKGKVLFRLKVSP